MAEVKIVERKELFCSSCKKSIMNDRGTVKFDCPQCGETVIIRCRNCRERAVKYTCAKCGFRGPN